MAEPRAARAWWVNQGTWYHLERAGGYLYAGQNKNTGPLVHHTDVLRLTPGDVVLHYVKMKIEVAQKKWTRFMRLG
jgi:hypothetical protein